MRSILIFIVISLFTNCTKHEQRNETINKVTDAEIYEIVNAILEDESKSLKKDGINYDLYKYLLDQDFSSEIFSKHDSLAFIKTDTVFSKGDLEFINMQINERKKFKFQQEFIKSKVLISSDTIIQLIDQAYNDRSNDFYDLFITKFGNHRYYTIGVPLFSLDKKTAFIKIDSYPGSGHTMIYKKINGKWKFYCFGVAWT